MFPPQMVASLIWGYLLFASTTAHAQRFRNAANARVAGGFPLDIMWDSTTFATASTIGVTASANSAASGVASTAVANITTNPIFVATNIRTPSASLATTASHQTVSQATALHTTRVFSSLSSRTTTARGSPTSIRKRAANPECLKTVELSCLNLAANCLSAVNFGVCQTGRFYSTILISPYA